MKNLMKFMTFAGILTMTAGAEQTEQQPQKSAMEQHKEAITAQTQRWIDATKNGAPSPERIQELVAANRRIIEEIWKKESERQVNAKDQ